MKTGRKVAQQFFFFWLTRWRHSVLLRRLSMLTSGTIFAQAAQLLNFVLLAKLYSLSEVGQYSIFAAIVGMLAPVALIGYDTLIPSASNENLQPYIKAMLLLMLPVGLLLGLLSMLVSYAHVHAVVIWVVGAAIHRVAEMYNVRVNRFRWISVARLAPPLMMTLLLVLLTWVDVQGINHLIQLQAGLTLVLGLTYAILTLPSTVLMKRFTITMMGATLRKSVNAPLYLMPSNLLNLAAYNIPVLVIGHWFSSELAAQYAYVLRFGFGPVGLIGGTLYQVFYGFLAEASRSADEIMFRQFIRARRYIGCAAVAVALGIAVAYPLAFNYLLGPEWATAGWISVIFSPLFAAMLYVTTQSVALNVFSLQQYELKSQVQYFGLSILSFGLAVISGNAWIGFVMFSALGFLRYVFLLRDINKVLIHRNVLS